MNLIDQIKHAHTLTGAPGEVIRVWQDGHYVCHLQYGEKLYRYKQHDNGVTVFCCWPFGRRQATFRMK